MAMLTGRMERGRRASGHNLGRHGGRADRIPLTLIALAVVWLLGGMTTTVAAIQGESQSIFSLAWSPDGTQIALGRDGRVDIVDATTGAVLRSLEYGNEGRINEVYTLSWSPDGTKLVAAGGSPNGLRVWEVATGQLVATRSIDAVAAKWHPDNVRIAISVTSTSMGIWDTSTLELTGLGQGTTMDWSSDGSLLVSASYSDSPITVTEVATGVAILTIETGTPFGISQVDLSPDNRRIANDGPGESIQIWDAATGQSLMTFPGHTDLVTSVAWSPDNRTVASGSIDSTVRFWDTQTGQPLGMIQAASWVSQIAWSPDGSRLAFVGEEAVFQVVPAPSPTPTASSLASTPTPTPVSAIPSESQSILSLAWSPDGTQIALGRDGWVDIVDATTGAVLRSLEYGNKGRTNLVMSLSWSPDGTKLVAAGGRPNGLRVWEVATGQLVATQPFDTVSAKWHPDSVHAVISFTSTSVAIWDTSTLELSGPRLQGTTMDWSSDGSLLVSASYSDSPITVTDVATGVAVLTIETGTPFGISQVDLSPDDRRIANDGPGETIQIWDATTGQSLMTFPGHTDLVTSVAWSPDNRTVASGSIDSTVRFWDTQTGQPLGVIQAASWVRDIAWSPDGSRLAYAGDEAVFQVVPAPQIATPSLTPTPTPSPQNACESDGAAMSQEHEPPFQYRSIDSLAWSQDGRYLAAAPAAADAARFLDQDSRIKTEFALGRRWKLKASRCDGGKSL